MNVSLASSTTQAIKATSLKSVAPVNSQDPDHDGDLDPNGVEKTGEVSSGSFQPATPGATGNNVDIAI